MNPEKQIDANEVVFKTHAEEPESSPVVDVEGILNTQKEVWKRLQSTIKSQLQRELADVIVSNDQLDNFAQHLREYYSNDVDALAIIDGGLADLLNQKKVQDCNQYGINVLQNAFIGFKPAHQANTLCFIASFLKGRLLAEDETIVDLQKSLRGKRILVLGDDTGSLSELLRHYGGESYGIEKDKFKLLIASSGLLSLNGQPQEQVFEGSIGDFFGDEKSQLLKKLEALGPFDMIVSDYVFNHGSGIEKEASVKALYQALGRLRGPMGGLSSEFLENASGYTKPAEKEAAGVYNTLTTNFRKNCDNLLNDNGLQLHLHVDMEHIFDVLHNDLKEKSRGAIVVPKNPQLRKRSKIIS